MNSKKTYGFAEGIVGVKMQMTGAEKMDAKFDILAALQARGINPGEGEEK